MEMIVIFNKGRDAARNREARVAPFTTIYPGHGLVKLDAVCRREWLAGYDWVVERDPSYGPVNESSDPLDALKSILSEDMFHIAVNRIEASNEQMRDIISRIYDIAQGAVAKADAANRKAA